MLIEDEAYDATNPPHNPAKWRDTVYRRTSFDGLELEGLMFDGLMEACTFTDCLFYWALFNVAVVVGTRFEECTFSSASLRGSTFVNCEFVGCRFDLDNLGSDCTIDDSLMAACAFERCEWISKPDRGGSRDITRTRWLGCSMTACRGFDGMF